ncbi:MAG: hypothetical protein FJW30_20570 [Acidobacteria bacterium]|nr:hypothetical protein [Acidobacteriota bacterium]
MIRLALILAAAPLAAQEPGMSLVPAGTFQMGRAKLTADDKTNMRPHVLLDDRPVHGVALDAFWMDTHETTHAQYRIFVKATKRKPPYHWTNGEMPAALSRVAIYNVDWHDAKAYCEHHGKRLPTEAEWERAARGGIEHADYPWGDKFDAKLARHNTEAGPGEPGKYPPNGFGLYDMAGNMIEWTADWYARDYYRDSPRANPRGPDTGAYRIVRGGAWSDPNKRITVFFRNWMRPNQKQPNLGIRCVKNGPAIEALIEGFQGQVSFYAKNLSTGAEYAVRPDERVRTASTIKLAILVALFEHVQTGKARWDEELTLTGDDKVSGSGVIQEFSTGRKFTLRDLAQLMIVVSDNTATNLILDRLTADAVNAVMEKYEFAQTRANRKILGDGKNLKANPSGWSEFGRKDENKKFGIGVSTPREMARLLEMLDKGALVSPAASKEMIEILKRQQYKDGIGRRLEGYTVASKSGALDALRSDAGLVYGTNEKYVLALTVDGMAKTDYSADNAGNALIADLTGMLLAKLR